MITQNILNRWAGTNWFYVISLCPPMLYIGRRGDNIRRTDAGIGGDSRFQNSSPFTRSSLKDARRAHQAGPGLHRTALDC